MLPVVLYFYIVKYNKKKALRYIVKYGTREKYFHKKIGPFLDTTRIGVEL